MKQQVRGKSSGILYRVGKRWVPWQLGNQFRRINLNGVEDIPADKPVLIAANHPTAFIDPVILGVLSRPALHFMTRGDLFNKPFARKVFESFNMFPVKRSRDGFTDLDRFDELTQYVMDSMEARKALCIFVEGMHHHDMRLLPIQKGIAKIAFTAYEKYRQDDLQIIPVGFAYWTSDQPRDVASVNVGKPIFIKDYWESYQNLPAGTIIQLCKDIYSALLPLCLHVNHPEDDKLAEKLLRLQRAEHPVGYFPIVQRNTNYFEGEKRVTDWVNSMNEEEKTKLKKKVKKYLSSLEEYNLDDEALLHPEWASAPRWIFLALCFPFFVVGGLVRFPIAAIATHFMKTKVQKREFRSSIYLGAELVLGSFWILLLIIAAFVSGNGLWIGTALALPLLYWFSIVYKEAAERTFKAMRALQHPYRKNLLKERAQL